MDIAIRHATDQDGAAIKAYLTALRAEAPDTLRQRPPPGPGEIELWLESRLTLDRSFVLVALQDGTVVGLLDLQAGQRPDNRHAGRFGLSVGQEHRGRRIGRALIERALMDARQWQGFCRIELECVAWNLAAIALYQSLGFEIEGVKRKGVNLRGQPEDDVLMALVW